MKTNYIPNLNQCHLFQEGAICLHEAAKQGHVSVVKSLLIKGASVNVMTKVCCIYLIRAFRKLFLSLKCYFDCNGNELYSLFAFKFLI